MRIVVDGDAFPNLNDIELLARKYLVELVIFMDYSHQYESDYADVKYVSPGSNSVDTKIENYVKCGDIVLTQDYGVAIICLGLDCICINQYGYLYDDSNLNFMLEIKNNNYKMRKYIKIKGPKKRCKDDRDRLLKVIEDLIR